MKVGDVCSLAGNTCDHYIAHVVSAHSTQSITPQEGCQPYPSIQSRDGVKKRWGADSATHPCLHRCSHPSLLYVDILHAQVSIHDMVTHMSHPKVINLVR